MTGSGDGPLEDIARRAGVGIGTLYRRFPKRLDLLEAAYREEVDALAQSQQRLAAEVSPWEGLDRWLHLLVGYVATKRVLIQGLAEAIGKESEPLTRSREVLMESTAAMLKAAQDAGVARPDMRPDDLVRIVGGCTMMPHVDPAQQERMVQSCWTAYALSIGLGTEKPRTSTVPGHFCTTVRRCVRR